MKRETLTKLQLYSFYFIPFPFHFFVLYIYIPAALERKMRIVKKQLPTAIFLSKMIHFPNIVLNFTHYTHYDVINDSEASTQKYYFHLHIMNEGPLK